MSANLATLAAAALAAFLGVVNLVITTYSTGRRERLKWVREALSEATFNFVDASYRTGDAVRRVQALHWDGADAETVAGEDATLWEHRELLRNSLTKLRVLSNGRTVEKGRLVREATSDLCHALGPSLSKERYDELREAVAGARAEFISSTRRHMGLRG